MAQDYKTMRVPREAWADAQDAKRDGETWGEYLRRCAANPPEVREYVEADAEGTDYDDVVAACRQAIREELPVEDMGARR